MSYNGSGTFVINTAGQPVVTGTVISSTAFNLLTADLGTGLSTAITKDGQTATTARIPFVLGLSSALVTDTTSGSTGSIFTAGGIGIAKAVYVGTTATVVGTTTLAAVTATSITDSGLTSGRVTFASTAGLLADAAALAWDGTSLSATKFAGALNGTVGATTPASVAATTGTFSSTLGVTGVATLGNGAILGTPASGTATNLTGLPLSTGVTGTLGAANGGTGVANNAAMTVTGSGNYAYTRTLSGTTNVTLPTTGTLATLAGSETFTNKTLTNPTITAYLETAPAIVNSSTSQTIALASGTVLSYTLTGNCTFTMPTATSGTSFIVRLIQDGTGSRTATFTGVKWPGGTAPTITTTASTGVDVISFVCIASVWYGNAAQAFA